MRRHIKAICAVVLLAAAAGCSSPAYWADRKRDAMDIFTFTVGEGYGVKARAGFVNAGLFYNSDIWGLRGGAVFSVPSHGRWGPMADFVCPVPIPPGWLSYWWLSSADFFGAFGLGDGTGLWDKRHKNYQIGMPLVPFLSLCDKPYYYTELEVAGGLWYTVRLGLNPGELVDFLLGWTTLDILGDDVGLSPTREEEYAFGKAIREGNIARVTALLNADPRLSRCEDGSGLPILSWAGHWGNPEIVKLLLDRGADVSARGPGGQTALFNATRQGNLAAVKVLVEAGIDVHAKDAHGRTALFEAVYAGRKEIAELLCEHGARIDEKDRNGHTAVELAMVFCPGVVEAMRAAAAKWDAEHKGQARP